MKNNSLILCIGGAASNIITTLQKGLSNQSIFQSSDIIVADVNQYSLTTISTNFEHIKTITLNWDIKDFSSEIFNNISKLLIVVGLGGKTGSEYSLYAIKKAKELGIKSIFIIATIPFKFEGGKRKYAQSIAQQLSDLTEKNIHIIDNEDLITKHPDINWSNVFNYADIEVINNIKSLNITNLSL